VSKEITPKSKAQIEAIEAAAASKVGQLITRLWQIRLLRFLVVGSINTIFSYIVYAILILAGAHYSLATLISTVLGVIFNFFTTGRIVFRNMDNKRFISFVLVYAFTYLINILLLRWLIDGLAMEKLFAGALVTLPVALLSYFLNAKLTFKDKLSTPLTDPQG
jgi:putative flippase GtrA